jgi:hypothetical protein
MADYITTTDAKHFQPMNASFALIPGLEGKKIRNKRERHEKISERGLQDLEAFKEQRSWLTNEGRVPEDQFLSYLKNERALTAPRPSRPTSETWKQPGSSGRTMGAFPAGGA